MNKKALSPLVATILLVSSTIIISVVIIHFIRTAINSDEYCSNHPEDCECSSTCKEKGLSKEGIYNNEGKFTKEFKEKCFYKDEIFKSDKCYEYQKKNPCQLKLEKESVLGENCFCEKEKEVGYNAVPSYCIVNCTYKDDYNKMIVEIDPITNKTTFKIFSDMELKIIQECLYLNLPECIPEVVYQCNKARPILLSDYSCKDLENIYPMANPLGKYDQYSKEDINHNMILNGCGGKNGKF